ARAVAVAEGSGEGVAVRFLGPPVVAGERGRHAGGGEELAGEVGRPAGVPEAAAGVVAAAEQASYRGRVGGADERRRGGPVLVVEEVVEVGHEAAGRLGGAPVALVLDGEDGGVDAALLQHLDLERLDLGGRAVAGGVGARGFGAVVGGAVASGGEVGLGPGEVGVVGEGGEGGLLLAVWAVKARPLEAGEGVGEGARVEGAGPLGDEELDGAGEGGGEGVVEPRGRLV